MVLDVVEENMANIVFQGAVWPFQAGFDSLGIGGRYLNKDGNVVEDAELRDGQGKVKADLQYVRSWSQMDFSIVRTRQKLLDMLDSEVFFKVPVVLHVFNQEGLASDVAQQTLQELTAHESIVVIEQEALEDSAAAPE